MLFPTWRWKDHVWCFPACHTMEVLLLGKHVYLFLYGAMCIHLHMALGICQRSTKASNVTLKPDWWQVVTGPKAKGRATLFQHNDTCRESVVRGLKRPLFQIRPSTKILCHMLHFLLHKWKGSFSATSGVTLLGTAATTTFSTSVSVDVIHCPWLL